MAYNYDKNIDYKSLLDKAVASGDMTTAATLEAQRNAKIAGEGLGYQQTNDYSKYLPDGGINAPTYTDTTKAQRYALTAQLLSPQKFTYNAEDDPLYNTYKEQYTTSGNKAMQDTLAQVSARTGGLASSYAGQAAQQTYNGYMEQLSDKIPELYQLAYNQFLQEYSQNLDKLSLLRQQEQDEYAKYADALSQYNTDRNWNYQQYLDNQQYLETADTSAGSGFGYGTDESGNEIKYGDPTLNSVLAYAKTDPTIAMNYGETNWDNMNWGSRYALLQAVGYSAADAGKYANLDKASVSTIFSKATQTPEEKTYTKHTSIDSYSDLKKWANENKVTISDALNENGFASLKNNAVISESEYNMSKSMQKQYGSYAKYVAIKKQFKSYEDYYDYLQDYLGYITSQK